MKQQSKRITSAWKDCGPDPAIIPIACWTRKNENYRTVLWTGDHMQLTLMSIPVGGDIGLEIHPHLDQFLRIEQGCALVQMGPERDMLNLRRRIDDRFGVVVPAGTWHNIVNVGTVPLKLYSIYAPPQHPAGAVHRTKADAEKAEAGN